MPIMYRGIALDQQTADADRMAIWQTGQLVAKSFWKNTMARPAQIRSRSSELAGLPGKVRDEIGRLPQTPLAYACGDFEGAARYALRERGTPVVISFKITLEEVMIDGRDFLYTVFQLWDRGGTSHRDRVQENLSMLFGPAMLGWFDRACRETDTMARIGLCDLAVHDLAAIERHYANKTGIAGRHNRVFRSSFALPANLDPAAILDIQEVGVAPTDPARTIHLHTDMLTP
jgi:hypothetical protein